VFLRGYQVDTERWAPYLSWAREQLNGTHTVITFNFDGVPEILQKDKGRLTVVDPTNVENSIRQARAEDNAPVLKLHGSITWDMSDAKGFEMTYDPEAALSNLDTRHTVIGLPGPQKRGLYAGLLKVLRAAAIQSLNEAGKVIFIGYRFPPTDADARQFLLRAIWENYGGGGQTRIRQVSAVLGPNTESPDARRLRHLLEQAVGLRPLARASWRSRPRRAGRTKLPVAESPRCTRRELSPAPAVRSRAPRSPPTPKHPPR